MAYENTWKRAHATSVVITPATGVAQTFVDATVIGIPGDQREVIEKTSLGAARKEWDPADVVDSPEITVTVPFKAAARLTGPDPADDTKRARVQITFASGGPTAVDIKAHIVGDKPGNAEVGGLLSREITIKPLGPWA
jgi:hypothetical protein